MQQSLGAMKAALRVLTALNEKRQPKDADIGALVRFAGPPPANAGLDEFACDVIQKALQRRAQVRGKTESAAR